MTSLGEWLLRARSRRACLALGALVGALVAAYFFRPGFLLGLDPYWEYPRGDIRVYSTAYLHFVQEPWSWPPGVSRTMGDPLSITFTDTIPIFSLPLKLVLPLVPKAIEQPFLRPFGLWLLIVYVAQGLVTARFAWRFGLRSAAGVVAACAIACTTPTLLFRWGHCALSAHFVIIWAIYLVVVGAGESPGRRRVVEWSVLWLVVGLIHPYLLAMVGPIFGAWIVTVLLRHRALRAVAFAIAGMGAVVLFDFTIMGLLSIGKIHGRPWGYGISSLNPLAFFLSPYALFAWTDPKLADQTNYQFEGHAYLGGGILLLLVVVLVRDWRAAVGMLRRHALLGVACALLAVYALSNRIYFGKWLLLSFEVPEALVGLTSQFRSTGRFVWPFVYAVTFFAFALVARQRRGVAILVGVALIQLVDVSPYRAYVAESTAPAAKLLDWPTWNALFDRDKSLHLVPRYECIWKFRPEDVVSDYQLFELGFIAATRKVTVNSIFNPRPRDCGEEWKERQGLVVEDGKVYVFWRHTTPMNDLRHLEAQGARCEPFDFGFACSRTFGTSPELVARFERTLVKTYDVGSWATFGKGGTSLEQEGSGWGERQVGKMFVGDQRDGPRTTLHFILPEGETSARTLEYELEGNRDEPEPLGVEIEGVEVGTLRVPRGVHLYRFCLPPKTGRRISVDLVDHPRELTDWSTRVWAHRARLSQEPCETP